MFVLSNLCEAVAVILQKALQLYFYVVLIAVLVQWVRPDPFNPIIRFLRAATEPVFDWVRRKLPFTVVGMLDLSPIVVFILIQLLQMVVVRSLMDLSMRLRF